MDTLLTTFLSPAPATGMDQSPWAHQCKSLIEKCFVDVDFKVSSSKDVISDIGISHYKKDRGDSFTQTNDMWITSPFLEFEITPYSYQPNQGHKNSINQKGFFANYFNHQLYHMALDHRTYSAFQTPSYRGCPHHFYEEMNESNNRPCCWQELFNSSMQENNTQEVTSSCPCFMQEECNSYCDVHNLVIQDVAINKKNCFWSVYFKSPDDVIFPSIENCDYTHGDPDQCIVNPCYTDDGDDDACDETFEIEFTNEIQPYSDVIDFTNVHISCTNFGTDNSYDFYDLDDDDDYTELTYESSDDEDNGDLHHHSGLVFSSSCTTNIIISNADAYEIRRLDPDSTERNENQTRRSASKYHKNCCGHAEELDDMSNGMNLRKLSSSSIRTNSRKTSTAKHTKNVHFPEPSKLVTVHRLVTWPHAYKQARKGPWLRLAQESAHFRRRIMNLSDILDPVIKKKHAQFRKSENI